MRRHEVFTRRTTTHNESISLTPPRLYRQERDWTCSVACLRTILSAFMDEVPAEDSFVVNCGMQPGPCYSGGVKTQGLLNEEEYDVVYGIDHPEIEFEDILDLMKEGYYIMLESMVNYAHWMVLLGYYAIAPHDNMENYQLLFYDPYYNQVRMINADEFIGMWIDGNYENTKVEKDFVAVRKKK
ncbi:MAG: hypothetical protein E7225_03045 [Clostridiales bacterium]|nr:hypothetical protein [Clostridiales bacterium]